MGDDRVRKIPLHWQIALALLLAFGVGLLLRGGEAPLAGMFLRFSAFLGRLFLQALKMLIVPLVVSAIINGISGVASGKDLGRLGLKTFLYYTTTTLFAVLIGLFAANLFTPGIIDGAPARDRIGLAAEAGEIASRIEDRKAGTLSDLFLRMIPQNVVAAAAEGEMLGLIVFSLLFGAFMMRLTGRNAEILSGFWQGLYEVMIRMTEWVMRFAPIGTFGLVLPVVASTGLSAIRPLLMLVFTVLTALGVHTFVILPLLLRFVGGIHPPDHFRAMTPALLTAFSTASSSATLPVTIDALERKAGLSRRTTSFVAPLGATVNMDGTALYECVAVLFIAQAYGVVLDPAAQLMVVLLALLTSVGVAGVPAASLVALVIILNAVGLPTEGIGLILAVDRILDMCRTGVNVFSDSCGAVIIGRSEGETVYGGAGARAPLSTHIPPL